MIFALLGIILGIILGFYIPVSYSPVYSLYVSVAILACIDSVIGGTKAKLNNEFDDLIFISGFVTNTILAIFLSYSGEKLGVPLYYGAIITFSWRMFQNTAIIRRYIIQKFETRNLQRGRIDE